MNKQGVIYFGAVLWSSQIYQNQVLHQATKITTPKLMEVLQINLRRLYHIQHLLETYIRPLSRETHRPIQINMIVQGQISHHPNIILQIYGSGKQKGYRGGSSIVALSNDVTLKTYQYTILYQSALIVETMAVEKALWIAVQQQWIALKFGLIALLWFTVCTETRFQLTFHCQLTDVKV